MYTVYSLRVIVGCHLGFHATGNIAVRSALPWIVHSTLEPTGHNSATRHPIKSLVLIWGLGNGESNGATSGFIKFKMAAVLKTSNGHVSITGHPIHVMYVLYTAIIMVFGHRSTSLLSVWYCWWIGNISQEMVASLVYGIKKESEKLRGNRGSRK